LCATQRISEVAQGNAILRRGHNRVEALVGEIANTRSEAEAERVAEGEEVIGETGGVGVVLFDPQVGLMVEKTVEHEALRRARCRTALTNRSSSAMAGIRIRRRRNSASSSRIRCMPWSTARATSRSRPDSCR